MKSLLLAAFAIATPLQAHAQRRMAVTVDDVPWVGNERPASRSEATTRMIEALRRHAAPVAVFVTCARLSKPDPLLNKWLVAGATIGNHTSHHRNLNVTPVEEWLDDVRSCDADLRRITKAAVRFFRFPMLHEGMNKRQTDAARALMTELGYLNGHVTVDNSDFVLVRPYSEAVARGDAGQARRIATRALTHDLAATRHFEEVAQRKVGREVPHIILLHANAMTAAMLPQLLDSLRQRGYQFISIEAALRDSLYRRPTCYVGKQGLSFLYRIAPCSAGQDAWDLAEQGRLTKWQ